MIWIALAGAVAPPQQSTGDLRSLFTVQDYLASALERNEQGAVMPELIINPDGRIVSCTIVASSGYSDLDFTTCGVLRKRAKFEAAVGPDGAPVYTLVRTVITYGLGGPLRAVQNPDIELSINQAPPGVTLPFDVWIGFLRKADGTVKACHGSSKRADIPKALVDLACNAAGEPPLRLVRNASNEPVNVLDTAIVRFVLDKR